MGRLVRIACAAAVLVTAAAGVAGAHESSPDIRTDIDPLPAALAGVTIQVAASVATQLVAENPTEDVLEVIDDQGNPFLRIGPEGVQANLSSPAWYTTNDPTGLAAPPDGVDTGPEAEPRWALASEEPAWGWFDHRLHPTTYRAPVDGEPTVLAQWRVPVRYAGEETAVTGAVRYEPLLGSFVAALSAPVALADVQLAVLQGRVPAFFLDYTGADAVTVLGAGGEPFLRFSAGGVEANLRSPSWIATAQAEGGVPAAPADADAEPDWAPVATVPRFGWLDPRAAFHGEEPPPEILAGGVEAVVASWTLPIEAGGATTVAEGVTSWVPIARPAAPDDGSDAGAWLRPLAAVAAVGALLGTELWRRRRRTR